MNKDTIIGHVGYVQPDASSETCPFCAGPIIACCGDEETECLRCGIVFIVLAGDAAPHLDIAR